MAGPLKLDRMVNPFYHHFMIHELTKDRLTISVNERGAELSSFKLDGYEYLWQGDENSWTGQSPLLFPVIGGLPDNKYTLAGKSYTMGGHGFARKTDFTLKKKTENSLIFSLSSSNATLAQFPFEFELLITYTLKKNDLTVGYQLKNHSTTPMTFSIGGHPGFKCPLEEKLDFSDYQLIFNKKETLSRRFKGESLLNGQREAFLDNCAVISLNHELFERGALIFKGQKSTSICLQSPKGHRQVTMDFTGFPYFGIWKKQETQAPYVCLEPWYGIDSTEGDSGRWEEKEGLETLEAGGVFDVSYSVKLE